MPTIVLDLLKYAFLAVLYIFLAWAVRAIFAELRPARARSSAPARKAAPPQRAPAKPKKAPRRAVIVEGASPKGKTFPLDGELLIGRGDKCQIVLQDSYASQVHARLFRRGEQVMVEDMGSTNGTYLNRQKLTAPTEVQRGDRVKIGKTVLEMSK